MAGAYNALSFIAVVLQKHISAEIVYEKRLVLSLTAKMKLEALCAVHTMVTTSTSNTTKLVEGLNFVLL